MGPGNAVVINRPAVIFDTQGDETVVIDLGTGRYFRLDAPSTRVWLLFENPVDPSAIVAASDDPARVAPEIERIVAELRDAGLLRSTDEATGPVAPWTFEGFSLETFTDLEDILGLDPIHEVDADSGWPHIAER